MGEDEIVRLFNAKIKLNGSSIRSEYWQRPQRGFTRGRIRSTVGRIL